jgi:DNA-directed RNA polymerase subunit M/transcription elongation factor TFIIS
MVMWKAKKCPNCGGDMYIDVDEDTCFDHCLQCGYMKNLTEVLCKKCGELITVDNEEESRNHTCQRCGNNAESCRSVR